MIRLRKTNFQFAYRGVYGWDAAVKSTTENAVKTIYTINCQECYVIDIAWQVHAIWLIQPLTLGAMLYALYIRTFLHSKSENVTK